MVNKPDYIQFIELQEGVFSIMKFPTFEIGIIKYLDEKTFDRVYEVSTVNKSGKAKWEEVIYKTKQEFYLHLYKVDYAEENYWMNIYYKPEKRNELLFFTTQVIKPFTGN